MPGKQSIVVMVQLETDDPRLIPEAISDGTPKDPTVVREAVVAALPSVQRVLLLMHEKHARMMVEGHINAMRMIGEGDLVRNASGALFDRKL